MAGAKASFSEGAQDARPNVARRWPGPPRRPPPALLTGPVEQESALLHGRRPSVATRSVSAPPRFTVIRTVCPGFRERSANV
jgi:hypothetical protein